MKILCYRLLIIVLLQLLFSGCNIISENIEAKISESDTIKHVLFIIGDDWSHPHYENFTESISTPTILGLANRAVYFTRAYCSVSSCTPSRATILTGQDFSRMKQGGVQNSFLPKEYSNLVNILEEQGFYVGHSGKVWGPWNYEVGGYIRNPVGYKKASFDSFLTEFEQSNSSNFFFWFGSRKTHLPYNVPSHESFNPAFPRKIDDLKLRAGQYASLVHEFDHEIDQLIQILKRRRLYRNTLIVIVGDNGWPLPRGKTEMYDLGINVPLIISASSISDPGVYNGFTSLIDLAPTILDIFKIDISSDMTGKSYIDVFRDRNIVKRNYIIAGKERHALARAGGRGYPIRAIRTDEWLLIKNYKASSRYPCGDPPNYGDCFGGSELKQQLLKDSLMYKLVFEKRKKYELYNVVEDPLQVENLADSSRYSEIGQVLEDSLNNYLKVNLDPRALGLEEWDTYPYYGHNGG